MINAIERKIRSDIDFETKQKIASLKLDCITERCSINIRHKIKE
jgi:hypothetical protein